MEEYLDEGRDGDHRGSRLGSVSNTSKLYRIYRVIEWHLCLALYTFLGIQIPSLLESVESNGTMHFESSPMLMDRMDIWKEEALQQHCLIWLYMYMKRGLHVDLHNAVIDGFAQSWIKPFGKTKSISHNLKQLLIWKRELFYLPLAGRPLAKGRLNYLSSTGILIYVNKTPTKWYCKRQATVESFTYWSELVAGCIVVE